MMLRFMGGVEMIAPDIEVIQGMGGIIEEVADYKNQTASIGYSFRYYIESIVCHPDIKMIAVSGVEPTVENIQNRTYPLIAPVYAVTYEGNTNPNVDLFINWMLSDEGQYIISESGYVGMK